MICQTIHAHKHLVVEPSPYPDITDLGAWMRIVHIYFELLPYLQWLTRATYMFPYKFGIKIFRSFPQFECVALYIGLANSFFSLYFHLNR